MGLLVGLALVTSCGGDSAGRTEVGDLGMTLSTTNGDVVYRLRDALFQIRGPENRDVCTEDYSLDDSLIFVALGSGDYQVAMHLGAGGSGGTGGAAGGGGVGGGAGGMAGSGGAGNCPNWYMEYSARGRPYEPIDAVLVSANPVDVRVNTDETTYVYFQFEVDGRLIDFGPGTLGIGIDVTENPPIGGAGWVSQDGGTTEFLLGVSFTDENTGTAVGEIGTIVRTTDGGTTWTAQDSGALGDLSDVSFVDANTGTAVGQGGTIVRTTDGGTTWVTQSSGTTNHLRSVSFTDANTGTAVGGFGTILRTTDGGGG
jgi:hypothetical protein